MLSVRPMRLALLALAVALAGCPSPDAPETDSPFSDVYKSKQQASGGDATPEAVDPEDAAPETAAAPRLVEVDQQATVRDPQDTFLHLRAGPSSQTASLERMPNGASVRVNSCRSGTVGRRWCAVTFEGLEGWAFETGLVLNARPASPREEAAPRTATINDPDGWTNLRASASTRAEVITRLISGSRVEVIACIPPQNGSRSRWCEVEAFTVSEGTLSGWIAESRLRYP